MGESGGGSKEGGELAAIDESSSSDERNDEFDRSGSGAGSSAAAEAAIGKDGRAQSLPGALASVLVLRQSQVRMSRNVRTQVETGQSALRPTRIRWNMLAWLCSFAAVTYIGRIGIIQVQSPIERDLHLTPVQLGYAFAAFSLAYALVEVPSGWLGDKIGPRKVLIRIALFWVAFTALTGLAWGLVSLVVFRFFFGTGEARAFPNIGRASREWFPFRERGLAQGMIWLSARWGGALAPLIMLVLAYPFGWRGGFVLMALIGVAWLWGFRRRFKDTPKKIPPSTRPKWRLSMKDSAKRARLLLCPGRPCFAAPRYGS